MATRRERVVLELQDDFTSGMARAAAATALLDKNLDSLSGSAVKSRTRISDMNRGDALPALNRNAGSAGSSINMLTGRLRLFADAAAVLGPALIPLGAAAVPALSGMATQLTLTAAAGGTAMLAFKGLGDGLKALNEYQLEPSEENLEKMNQALSALGPAGEGFLYYIESITPRLRELQTTARSGLFPGVADGIDSLLDLLPQLNDIVGNVAEGMGQLAREAGAGLSGAGFTAFFDYLENDAQQILLDMGRTVGKFAEGLANMMVAFAPLTDDFSGGLLKMSRSFAEWAATLEQSRSFQEFVSYVQESAPKAMDLLGSLVDAFVGIAQAAAPIGDVVLPVLTAMVDVIATIADSDVGSVFITAAAGLTVYTRAAGLAASASKRLGIAGTTGLARFNAQATALKGGLKIGAAALGGLALASTDVDDKIGLSNTAMLGMAGMMLGPWGAAAGASVGLMMDLAGSTESTEERTQGLTDTLNEQTGAITRRTREWAASKIVDAGIADDMYAIGLSAKDLTDVLLGTGDAARVYAEAVSIRTDPSTTAAEKNAAGQVVEFLEDQGHATQDVIAKEKERKRVTIDALGGVSLAQQRARTTAGRLTSQYYDLEAANEALVDSLERSRRVLDQRGSLRDYQASLDDFADALDKVKDKAKLFNKDGTFNLDLPKAREIQELLDGIAREGLEVAEGLKGTNRIEALRQARRDFVDAAQKAGLGRVAVKRLADQIFDMPIRRATEIVVRTDRAKGNLDALQKQLKSIDGDYYARIHARMPNMSGFGAQITSADGSTVPGPRQPYGDKVHALVAPGEEIISNRHGQADRHRDLLKAINANRYANGGTVMSNPFPTMAPASAPAGPSIDYGRLAAAMAQVRPIYGNVTVHGDPAAFKRQALADRQQASLGGV